MEKYDGIYLALGDFGNSLVRINGEFEFLCTDYGSDDQDLLDIIKATTASVCEYLFPDLATGDEDDPECIARDIKEIAACKKQYNLEDGQEWWAHHPSNFGLTKENVKEFELEESLKTLLLEKDQSKWEYYTMDDKNDKM